MPHMTPGRLPKTATDESHCPACRRLLRQEQTVRRVLPWAGQLLALGNFWRLEWKRRSPKFVQRSGNAGRSGNGGKVGAQAPKFPRRQQFPSPSQSRTTHLTLRFQLRSMPDASRGGHHRPCDHHGCPQAQPINHLACIIQYGMVDRTADVVHDAYGVRPDRPDPILHHYRAGQHVRDCRPAARQAARL